MVRRKSGRPLSVRSETSSKTLAPTKKNSTTTIVQHRSKKRQRMTALQEIKFLRKSTRLLIPKAPFSRLVREIVMELFPRLDINRMQNTALEALQEAAEMYLTQFFEDAVLLTLHAKRVTLMRQDMILMRRLRGRDDVINR